MDDITITDKMIKHYLEDFEAIDEAIVNKINQIYYLGEELGFAPKFIDFNQINEIWLDDNNENIILNYNVFVGEWIDESYEFPYKLFCSKNPTYEMQKMAQQITNEILLKNQLMEEMAKINKSRNEEIQRKNDIKKLKELMEKYPEEI